MLDLIDMVLRPLGWLIAVAISFGAVVFAGAVSFMPMHALASGRHFLLRAMAWLAAAPLFAIVLFVEWRLYRFAGGYVGSSDYPFEHVVALFR